jgi:hypothetical protein
MLIEDGARLKGCTSAPGEKTPLEAAITMEATNNFEALLAAGADPKGNRTDSWTLKLAASQCHLDMTATLLVLHDVFHETDRDEALKSVSTNWPLYGKRAPIERAILTSGASQEAVGYAWQHCLKFRSRPREINSYQARSDYEDEDLSAVMTAPLDTRIIPHPEESNHLHSLASNAKGIKALKLILGLPGIDLHTRGQFRGRTELRTPLQLVT